METLFVKYATNRNPEFQIMTTIARDENGRQYAIKEAMLPEAEPHVKAMHEHASMIRDARSILRVPEFSYENGRFISGFVKGASIADEMQTALRYRKIDTFRQLWHDYAAILHQLPGVVCQPGDLAESSVFKNADKAYDCLTWGHIDLIAENIIRSDAGIWNIDYEWFMDTPVPVQFILYRSALVFHNKHCPLYPDDLSLAQILRWLDVDQDIAIFEQWERLFSEYVHGRSPMSALSNYTFDVPDLENWSRFLPTRMISSLYYSETIEFSEDASLKVEIAKRNRAAIDFRFDKSVLMRHLRWDPCDGVFIKVGTVAIDVYDGDGNVRTGMNLQSNGIVTDSGTLFLTTDPQISLDLGSLVNVNRVTVHAEMGFLDYGMLERQLANPVLRMIDDAREAAERQKAAAEDARSKYGELSIAANEIRHQLDESNDLVQRLAFINRFLAKIAGHGCSDAMNMNDASGLGANHPVRSLRTWLQRLRDPLAKPNSLFQFSEQNMCTDDTGAPVLYYGHEGFVISDGFPSGVHYITLRGMASEPVFLSLQIDDESTVGEGITVPFGLLSTEYATNERFIQLPHAVKRLRLTTEANARALVGIASMSAIRLGRLDTARIGLALIRRKTGVSRLKQVGQLIRMLAKGQFAVIKEQIGNVLNVYGASN